MALKHKSFPQMKELSGRGFTDWMEPDEHGRFIIVCCDCRMTHLYEFRGKDVRFRARQSPRYTAQQRRKRGK